MPDDLLDILGLDCGDSSPERVSDKESENEVEENDLEESQEFFPPEDSLQIDSSFELFPHLEENSEKEDDVTVFAFIFGNKECQLQVSKKRKEKTENCRHSE